jgi:hypothetical protein
VLHAGVYLVVNGFFTVTWLLAPRVDEQFWPAWIMLLLAVPLACTPPPWWPPGHHAGLRQSRGMHQMSEYA